MESDAEDVAWGGLVATSTPSVALPLRLSIADLGEVETETEIVAGSMQLQPGDALVATAELGPVMAQLGPAMAFWVARDSVTSSPRAYIWLIRRSAVQAHLIGIAPDSGSADDVRQAMLAVNRYLMSCEGSS